MYISYVAKAHLFTAMFSQLSIFTANCLCHPIQMAGVGIIWELDTLPVINSWHCTFCRKLRDRDVSKFHIQLCTALFCLLLVFVSGIQQTSVYGGCVTVSVLIHYFTLVTWMWMGTEAMIMFQKVVIVFFRITTKFIVAVSFICWCKYIYIYR